jgi:hypothetical protein
MSETVSILLRFHADHTSEFERLFKEQVLPLWHEFKAQGKFIAASLTPALDSPEMKEGVHDYILLVHVPSRAEHDQFDTDPRFLQFLDKVKPMQPGEPKVWLGNTMFQI